MLFYYYILSHPSHCRERNIPQQQILRILTLSQVIRAPPWPLFPVRVPPSGPPSDPRWANPQATTRGMTPQSSVPARPRATKPPIIPEIKSTHTIRPMMIIRQILHPDVCPWLDLRTYPLGNLAYRDKFASPYILSRRVGPQEKVASPPASPPQSNEIPPS